MTVRPALARTARHWWWTFLAGCIAYVELLGAAGNLTDAAGPYAGQTIVVITLAVMVIVGLCIRSHRRISGDVLIVLGAAPAVMAFWVWPIVVMAVVVLVFGLIDVVDARAVHGCEPRARIVTLLVVGGVVATVVATVVLTAVGDVAAYVAAGGQLALLVVLVAAAVARRPVRAPVSAGRPRAA